MSTALESVRLFNLVLALGAVVLCVTKASHYWNRYNNTAKAFTMSLTLFALAGLWGTSEQLVLDVAPGPRVLVLTIALLYLWVGLITTRGRSFYVEFKDEPR